ncbi:MAG: HAD family phosphatase [Planctomycetes bacterium]|nr:HAD family phosphatase [Planctomycetota bacterium]
MKETCRGSGPGDASFRRRYRLLALDLDGTLINRRGEIQEADREALRRTEAAGATIALASGRMGAAIQPVFDQLGLDGPIIAYNGAMVKLSGRAGRATIFHQPVHREFAQSIVDFVYWFNAHAPEGDRLHLNYYLEDLLYAHAPTVWSDRYHRQTGSIFHYVGDLRQFHGQSPTKLIVMTHPERRDILLQLLSFHLPGRVYLAKTWPEYHLEIMDAGVNKGVALLALARHLGIGAGEIMAFGDAGNDVPMLELEGVFGVALASGTAEAIEAADWVAPGCDDCGVAAAIQSFFI